MIRIDVSENGQPARDIETRQKSFTIGRERCDLTLADTKVSRMHGEILWAGTRCLYRDLLSRNGSVVRTPTQTIALGPLMPEWPLNPGDEIVVGDTVIRLRHALREESSLVKEHPSGDGLEETGLWYDSDVPEDPIAPAEVLRFNKLLEVLAYDPTDVRQVRGALCEAFRQVFPNAECVALVGLLPGVKGPLEREQLDLAECAAEPPDCPVLFSFHVLREACRRQVPVLFVNRPDLHFPEAESVLDSAMSSCLCAPLGRGNGITAFVHLYTRAGNPAPFTPRDVQLLALLASVASLVLHSAQDAEERAVLRAVAAAGQTVAGLGHDTGKMMRTLGITADGVERAFPALRDNASWQELRRDVDFLRFVARDTMDRLSRGKGHLEPRRASVRGVAEEAWDRCRRCFLDEARADRVRFVNACDASHEAWIDPLALTQALMNCIQNSLDALRAAGGKQGHRRGTVRVVSSPDPEEPGRFLLLSVCDDGGGIPAALLARLAASRALVSTKGKQGSGLGLHLVADLVRRMHGRVRLSSSTEPAGRHPAGTVVALRLPRAAVAVAADTEAGPPALDIVPDYGEFRTRIEGILQENKA
jgi:signal transduction histidine kinase